MNDEFFPGSEVDLRKAIGVWNEDSAPVKYNGVVHEDDGSGVVDLGFDKIKLNGETYIADGDNTIDLGNVKTEQKQADWTEEDETKETFILHKPKLFSGKYSDLEGKPDIPSIEGLAREEDLADVAFSGSYNDLKNVPSPIQPTPQVQSDWDEEDDSKKSFILNKPEVEVVGNKVDGISNNDLFPETHYPSVKAVRDYVKDKRMTLANQIINSMSFGSSKNFYVLNIITDLAGKDKYKDYSKITGDGSTDINTGFIYNAIVCMSYTNVDYGLFKITASLRGTSKGRKDVFIATVRALSDCNTEYMRPAIRYDEENEIAYIGLEVDTIPRTAYYERLKEIFGNKVNTSADVVAQDLLYLNEHLEYGTCYRAVDIGGNATASMQALSRYDTEGKATTKGLYYNQRRNSVDVRYSIPFESSVKIKPTDNVRNQRVMANNSVDYFANGSKETAQGEPMIHGSDMFVEVEFIQSGCFFGIATAGTTTASSSNMVHNGVTYSSNIGDVIRVYVQRTSTTISEKVILNGVVWWEYETNI